MLIDGSGHISPGTVFKNYVPRALLWCGFQTIGKIAQNLSIFVLH